MSGGESPAEFERNARVVLEESVRRIDARTRSRLNQARHAALAAAGRRGARWGSFTLMPTAGAVAAALLVAGVLWYREPAGTPPLALVAPHATAEDMDLLTDNDSIDLMEGWDGSFYEWAAAQSDAGAESNS
jgi:hypothetical protein